MIETQPRIMQSVSIHTNPSHSSGYELNALQIKSANFITSAVNNTFRQRLIGVLLVNGQLPVKELCSLLNTQQSIVSQHLAMLRRANLVTASRSGKCVMYTVNLKQLNEVLGCLASMCK